MGMTIDKTISELEILKKNTFSYMTANQAFTTAIDTMRKYQKIQEIATKWQNEPKMKFDTSYYNMAKIIGVLEDGNDR